MVMHVTFILGKKGKFEIRVQPLFHLGVVEVVNIIDTKSQKLLEFDDAKDGYVFHQNLVLFGKACKALLRCLPMMIVQLLIGWCLKGSTRVLMVSTNMYVVCTHHVPSLPWL